jgi:hypothetical protein
MFFGYPSLAVPKQWQIHAAESTGEAFELEKEQFGELSNCRAWPWLC